MVYVIRTQLLFFIGDSGTICCVWSGSIWFEIFRPSLVMWSLKLFPIQGIGVEQYVSIANTKEIMRIRSANLAK